MDVGSDDCVALLTCLQASNLDIVAITASHGNSPVDQVVQNIGVILKHMDRKEIPIYKGCKRGFISQAIEKGWEGHGEDGMGDSKLLSREGIPEPQKTHAS
jgi:purine nucleosidase